MSKQGISLVLLLTPLLLAFSFYAHAHAGEEHSASYNLAAVHLAQDESVDPASLGVGTPNILPGNPFYFFKNLSRGVRSVVAFGNRKAELKLQFANEKIVEAQLLLDRGDKVRAVEHLKSYEKDLARAKGIADKKKFIAQSFRHQAVLDKIEKAASEEKAADVKNVREKTVGHIAEVVASFEDAQAAKEALIAATSDEGSAFKPLRNLEVLKAVEEKVPEQAKDAVRAAQENAVKRFKSEYDKGTAEEKDALTEYIKGAGGDASRYMEVFNENKEILGEELSQTLLSAGEEKKSAGATKAPISPPAGGASATPPPAPAPQKKISPKPAPAPESTPKMDESTSKAEDTSTTEPAVTEKQDESSTDQSDETQTEDASKVYEGSPPLLY